MQWKAALAPQPTVDTADCHQSVKISDTMYATGVPPRTAPIELVAPFAETEEGSCKRFRKLGVSTRDEPVIDVSTIS
jgi:hypothetical protein